MRSSLDKFYTKEDDVNKCLTSIEDFHSYDLIVEPSAGNGSFSKKIPNCLAYDIAPEEEGIIEQDFLKLKKIPKVKKVLFIGNPPFGQRSVLAKEFIKKCISLNAYTIAFILPNTFKKYTNQTVFNDSWFLHKIVSLSEEFTFGNKNIHIPCSFFIWSKENTKNDLRDYIAKTPKEFYIVKRGDINANFSINGNSGKVKEISKITNPKAEHYIRVKDGFSVDDIKNELTTLSYKFNSSVNGGISWINKNDIYKAWQERDKQQNSFLKTTLT